MDIWFVTSLWFDFTVLTISHTVLRAVLSNCSLLMSISQYLFVYVVYVVMYGLLTTRVLLMTWKAWLRRWGTRVEQNEKILCQWLEHKFRDNFAMVSFFKRSRTPPTGIIISCTEVGLMMVFVIQCKEDLALCYWHLDYLPSATSRLGIS